MPTFKELKEKKHVQDHPLFSNMDERVTAMRKNMSRTAKGVDLGDVFSQRKNIGLGSDDRTLRAFVQEAALVARSALDVCDFPIQPRLSYNNTKNVRVAAHDENQVVDAEVLFNVRISTISGAIRQAVLPVHVKSGAVIPPSTILYEQRMRVLAQSTVDEIVERNTSYALQPMRSQYQPPLLGEELDRAVEERNMTGYQPREVITDADGVRRTYSRDAQLVAPATEEPSGDVYFEEGDLVLFDAGGGQYTVAQVTQRLADLGSGRPGFRGIDPRTGMETYGFEDTVVDVLPGEKEVTIARRQAQDFDKKNWDVEGRPTTEDPHGLLTEKGHDPKKLDTGYKRELPAESERKKKRDEDKAYSDKVKNQKEQDEKSGKESQRLMAKMNSTQKHWFEVYLNEGDNYRTAFVKAMELSRKDAEYRKDAVWPFDSGKVTPNKVKKIVKQQLPGAMEQAIQQALPGAIGPQIQEQMSQAFPTQEQTQKQPEAPSEPTPTETTFQAIQGDPANYQRANEIAQSSSTPEEFAQALQSEPSFYQISSGSAAAGESPSEVDWNAIAEALLSSSQTSLWASTQEHEMRDNKRAQDDTAAWQVRPPTPGTGAGDIGSDPTQLSQMGPSPLEVPGSQESQYATGTPTEELYRQIVANTFIMDQVSRAINPPDADVVEAVYATVEPLLASFNINAQEIEWYDLVNDLRASTSDTQLVTGEVHRKMALVLAEHLSGRRRFGRRRAARDLEEVALDLAMYVEAAQDTFSEREHAYLEQLSKEALGAYLSEEDETAMKLVAELENFFFDKAHVEVPYEEWGAHLARHKEGATDIADEFKDQIADMEGMGLRSGEEDVDDFELQRVTPPGYSQVLGDMVEAEELGYDTFPRTYSHIEKNYILRRLTTCSRDQWYKHLVNDGFAINQWGVSRGRPRPGTDHKQGSRQAAPNIDLAERFRRLGPRAVYRKLPYLIEDMMLEYEMSDDEVNAVLDQVIDQEGWSDTLNELAEAESGEMPNTEEYYDSSHGWGRSDAEW